MSFSLEKILSQSTFLLSNFEARPNTESAHFLASSRQSKSAYLIAIGEEEPRVIHMYSIQGERDSNRAEEIEYSTFSTCGKFVYAVSTAGVIYVFETDTGKLASMVHLEKQDGETVKQIDVDGMISCKVKAND